MRLLHTLAPGESLRRIIAKMAASAAALAMMLVSIVPVAQAEAERSEPVIILGPLPEETGQLFGEPPPIPRTKPEPPAVSAPKAPQQRTPARTTPRRQAPAPATTPRRQAPTPAPQRAAECGSCKPCHGLSLACSRRQRVCGDLYRELSAAGLCGR